jgi:hypothetical protein
MLKSEIIESFKLLSGKHDLQPLCSIHAVRSTAVLHGSNSHKAGNRDIYITYSFPPIGGIGELFFNGAHRVGKTTYGRHMRRTAAPTSLPMIAAASVARSSLSLLRALTGGELLPPHRLDRIDQ